MGKRIEVKFVKEYCAARGAGIMGAKGVVKTFADSEDLQELIKKGIVKVVKEIKPPKAKKERKTPAKGREKATKDKRETS